MCLEKYVTYVGLVYRGVNIEQRVECLNGVVRLGEVFVDGVKDGLEAASDVELPEDIDQRIINHPTILFPLFRNLYVNPPQADQSAESLVPASGGTRNSLISPAQSPGSSTGPCEKLLISELETH